MAANETPLGDCWHRAMEAFGTSYIFERRLRAYRKKIRLLTFFGIAVPMTIGGVVVTFFGVADSGAALSVFILIAGLLSTLQLVITAWSLVDQWDDKASYASASLATNNRLSSQFVELAKASQVGFEVKFALLIAEDDRQQQADLQKEISPEEKRMGFRAGLLRYGRECPNCKKTPTSIEPTNCSTCGQF